MIIYDTIRRNDVVSDGLNIVYYGRHSLPKITYRAPLISQSILKLSSRPLHQTTVIYLSNMMTSYL